MCDSRVGLRNEFTPEASAFSPEKNPEFVTIVLNMVSKLFFTQIKLVFVLAP